jgi:LysR family transcriptional regulator, glycine cleavage system transcriptional activator
MCGTITAAADILGVSAGAVSQQIRVLETALGVPLFERHGRSLRLTKSGSLYYQNIHIAFDQLRVAQDLLVRSKSRSAITISALPSIAIRWLRPLLSNWQSINPESNILLVGSEYEPSFPEEDVDFRMTYGDQIKKFDHYLELFTDKVVPVCSPRYFQKQNIKSPIDILKANLIDIDWVVNEERPVSWSDWANFMGFEYTPMTSPSFSLSCSACDAAADGEGFVLGQLSMIATDLTNGRLIAPFDCSMSMKEPYFLAWNRDTLQTTFGNSFRSFLRKAGARQSKAVVGV